MNYNKAIVIYILFCEGLGTCFDNHLIHREELLPEMSSLWNTHIIEKIITGSTISIKYNDDEENKFNGNVTTTK